jgi:hypothetical protein
MSVKSVALSGLKSSDVPETGMDVPETGMDVPETGMDVSETELFFSNIRICT